jgi:hypothetical protein
MNYNLDVLLSAELWTIRHHHHHPSLLLTALSLTLENEPHCKLKPPCRKIKRQQHPRWENPQSLLKKEDQKSTGRRGQNDAT